jgi:hypothetical protein
MPRACSICRHPQRHEIDAAISSGGTLRGIAGQFRVSDSAVDRHRAHIGLQLADTEEGRRVLSAESIAQRLVVVDELLARAAEEARGVRDVVAIALAHLKVVHVQAQIMGPPLAQDLTDPEGAAARREQNRVDARLTRQTAKILESGLLDLD